MGREESKTINNTFYDFLCDEWYTASNHPIALLRAENKVRNPWIAEVIEKKFRKEKNLSVLDVGCGAGLLTNSLGFLGYDVSGIDLSEQSLKVAKNRDLTKNDLFKGQCL